MYVNDQKGSIEPNRAAPDLYNYSKHNLLAIPAEKYVKTSIHWGEVTQL